MPKATEHNITRRTALAGAAATFPAAAIPAFAFPSEPDPVFAVIEAHRAAYLHWSEAVRVSASMYQTDPGYDVAQAVTEERSGPEQEAAAELAGIVPATMAGVHALLDYIDAFNRGGLALPNDSPTQISSHLTWPEDLEEESVTDACGRPLNQPWPFWIMRNVSIALRQITGAA